jgi:hypothetical protein
MNLLQVLAAFHTLTLQKLTTQIWGNNWQQCCVYHNFKNSNSCIIRSVSYENSKYKHKQMPANLILNCEFTSWIVGSHVF